MQYNLWKKGLVLGIIALFVGVAIAPGITATVNLTDAASTRVSENKDLNNDPLEITVEIGNSEHKVMLTQDQVKELENIIDLTKKSLDAAETKKETSRIFNETVVSLYELGVLPMGMSIEEAQSLVNGMEQNPKIIKKLEGRYNRNQGILNNLNILCLIAGKTDETFFLGRVLPYIFCRLFLPIVFPSILETFWKLNPISFGCTISLSWWGGKWHPYHHHANGWVHTIGLNGIKKWNGSFSGRFFLIPIAPLFVIFPGVIGFTGLKISYEFYEHFYLGAALWVIID